LTGENHIYVVGYGNQARAWCANLKDSGVAVRVLLREASSSRARAEADGHKLADWQAPLPGHPMAFLVPDHEIAGALAALSPFIAPGTILFYAHGFALLEHKLAEEFPQFQHVLLAPKAIGTEVRATYLERRALGGVYSVAHVPSNEQAHVEKTTLKFARLLGITWGPYAVKVEEETTADLFSEQAVLCSVLPEACRLAFKLLREKNIPAELAYFELWHEVGLIVRTMVEKGPEAFFHLISPNALIGAELGRELLCDEHFEKKMRQLLADIESGAFARKAEATDAEELREKIVARWRQDEFGQTINRMQGITP